MSYTIIYNRCFIKTTDKYGQDYIVPMIQAGSNNCTQVSSKGREIRERSWEGLKYYTNGKIISVPEEILKGIDDERLSRMKRAEDNVKQYNDNSWEYDDNNFGYHASITLYGKTTSTTSFSAFRAFFSNGIKNAVTVEELIKNYVHIRLCVSSYSEKEIKEKGLDVKPTFYPKTSEELLEKAKEYQEYYGNLNCCYITVDDISMEHYFYKRKIQNKIKRQNNPKKQKQEVESYFVFKSIHGFLVKLTKKGYRYAYEANAYSTKKVKTEKEATTYLKKLKERFLATHNWEYVEVKEKAVL